MIKKTLQIHIGVLNSIHEKCIKSKEYIYNGLKHMFINDNNYYKILLEMCAAYNIPPELFTPKTKRGRVIISDFLRIYIMATMPDTLYIDTDVGCCEKFIPTNNKKPYFVKNDIWAIYNGANTEYFENYLINKKPPLLLVDIAKNKNINLIEEKYFNHYNLRSWKDEFGNRQEP